MRFTENHEWVRKNDEEFIVGISNYAAEQLGDIVYIDLPEVEDEFGAGDEIAVIESVKAAAEVYAPIGGVVTAVNPEVIENNSLVNADPEGAGWLIQLRTDGTEQLDNLTPEEDYREMHP